MLTGNLCIIGNKHICRLLIKGPSCREQNYINWDIIPDLLLKAVHMYKIKLAIKEAF